MTYTQVGAFFNNFDLRHSNSEKQNTRVNIMNPYLIEKHKPLMKQAYTINLLNGDHGIWVFLIVNKEVIFEQSCLKSVASAFEYAEAAIKAYENRPPPPSDTVSCRFHLQTACAKCTAGAMIIGNPHWDGLCECDCHPKKIKSE